MHDWDAKDGHDRVADELLDRAAVPTHDRLHPFEVARQQRPQRLRIGRLAELRRPHHITEEHSHDLALLRGVCGRRGPAFGAKLEDLSSVVAANRTCRHETSLGTRTR